MPRSATALIRLLPVPDAAPADAPLVRAFLSSDPIASEAAFAELVRRHGPMVLAASGACWATHTMPRTPSRQRSSFSLARPGRFAAIWLGGSTRWGCVPLGGCESCRNRRRSTRRERQRVAGRSRADTGHSAGDTDLAAVIDEELAKLPHHYREAIVLCELRACRASRRQRNLAFPRGHFPAARSAANAGSRRSFRHVG